MIEAIVAAAAARGRRARRAQGPRHRPAQLRPREGPLRRRRPDRAGPGAAALLPRRRPRQLRRDAHRHGQQGRVRRSTSQVDWVRDSTGGTESCNSNTAAGRLHADHVDDEVGPDQHPDPADHDVEPRRAARRRLRRQPGHARRPGQRPRRRGRRRASRSRSPAPATVTNPTNSAGCAIFAYVPVGQLHGDASTRPAGSTTAATQNATVGATVSQGKVNVATIDLRPRGERRR